MTRTSVNLDDPHITAIAGQIGKAGAERRGAE
jgi:hypothetical protein